MEEADFLQQAGRQADRAPMAGQGQPAAWNSGKTAGIESG